MTRSGIDGDIMLKLKDLDDRQCITHTVKQLPCGNQISKGELALATSKLPELHDLDKEEATTLKAIIKLLICANHRKSQTGVQLDALVRKYRSELLEFAKTREVPSFTSYHACRQSTRGSVKGKLGDVIKENEFRTGSIYGYTWEIVPDLIKIG